MKKKNTIKPKHLFIAWMIGIIYGISIMMAMIVSIVR